MQSKVVTVTIGMMFSLGLLLMGFYALDRVNKKEELLMVQGKMQPVLPQDEQSKEFPEQDTAMAMESLPNATKEAERWNETATDFIAMYSEFKMETNRIKLDEAKPSEGVTTFFHEFETSLNIRLMWTVDDETQEITEMKVVGYEMAGADRAAIFHAMSMFIGYVDREVTMEQAGTYLGEIPFSSSEEAVREIVINGKSYEYVLDLADGKNMLVYKVSE